ncbi:MAG: hypothetical protein ACP5O3_02535 [Candidatus Micrarchaeia archaeon]
MVAVEKKAVALFSGGLDSILAVKLLLDQGVSVSALHFTSLFCNCDKSAAKDGCGAAAKAIKQLGVPLTTIAKGMDYVKLVEHPKFGRGRAMNPCVDCRIYTLKRAKQFMQEIGASFLVSGEVLGQRPMSQNKRAMDLIEEEAGVQGILLRPLSAKLLPPTKPELEGVVDREKLLAISGRSRSQQIKMAEDYGLDYPCPSGGCMLTEAGFAAKLKDLFDHHPDYDLRDVSLLKVGRHFRFSERTKIIVGRNEAENKVLQSLKKDGETLLTPLFPGPSALVCGDQAVDAIHEAASLIAFYARQDGGVQASDGTLVAAAACPQERARSMLVTK